MGQVINISEPGLDLMLYGDKSSMLNNYLMNQMANVKPAFNEFSQRVFNSIQNSYNFINDRLIQYGLRSQMQNNGVNVLDNQFESLMSFEAIQHANVTMQRWIMAHPEIRQLYVNQNIDGYSGTYQNVFGKDVGVNDYNYRRVMDGVVIDTEDSFAIKNYVEDLIPGDRELDHYEKVTILHTYDAINHILDTCQFDFTNVTDEPSKINRE